MTTTGSHGGFMLGHSQCGPRDLLHNIADMLVSELQRRGRFRTAYTGATRDLFKSFGWGIRALRQLVAVTMVRFPRRLPHTISLWRKPDSSPRSPRGQRLITSFLSI